MNFKRRLPIPQEIKSMYPISEEGSKHRKAIVKEIRDVIDGTSKKYLLIIGPCSADRQDSVLEYLHRLEPVAEKVKDVLVIVPRIYTNKPRTTGAGYKGMLHQPDPLKDPDILKGLIAIRQMHMAAINETGFACADEMLYPENHRFLSDVLGYVAVGARSCENQQHRLTASGLEVATGVKNPTSGDLRIMMNSILAAQSPHTFIYRNWEVETTGNKYAHAILRGYVDYHGVPHGNYHYKDLKFVKGLYDQYKLANPAVIVDCNHDNSGKQYDKQIEIIRDVISSMEKDSDIKNLIKGFMVESYLVDGCQKPEGNEYGKSITDPCLGWEKSEALIYELADLLRKL